MLRRDGIRSRFLFVLDSDADSSTKRAAEQLAASFRDIIDLRLQPRGNLTLVRAGRLHRVFRVQS